MKRTSTDGRTRVRIYVHREKAFKVLKHNFCVTSIKTAVHTLTSIKAAVHTHTSIKAAVHTHKQRLASTLKRTIFQSCKTSGILL
jgi:hypothetical protein